MLKTTLLCIGIAILTFGSGFITYTYFKSTAPQKEETPAEPVVEKPEETTQTPAATEEPETNPVNAQNDTAMKNDLSAVVSNLTTYQANNRGQLPTTADEIASFNKNYLATTINATSKQPYELSVEASDGMSQIHYTTPAQCSDENLTIASDNIRFFALSTTLSDKSSYCVDNS